ncbi:MAG: SurA N-terminal domain-containing protein [Cumulibacter sp.]
MTVKFRRRAAGVLVGAALGVASLTACSMNANTVAEIGDETITTQELDQALEDAYADPIVGDALQEQGEAFRTEYLNDMLSYEISKAVAAEAGVSVSDDEIDEMFEESLQGQSVESVQAAAAAQGTPLTAEQMRMRIATNLVNAKFGEEVTGTTQEELSAEKFDELQKQREENPGQYSTFDVQATVTADQAFADDWASKVNEQGMTLQEAVDSNPDENNPAGTNEVSSETVDGAQMAQNPDVLEQLQAIDEGDTGVIVQGPDQNGAFVYLVVTMDKVNLTPDADLQAQADQAAQQEFFQAGMTEAAAQAKKIDIDVNPRYGTVEYPQQGLPSIGTPNPNTFSEPEQAADPSGGGLPGGVPGGVPTS